RHGDVRTCKMTRENGTTKNTKVTKNLCMAFYGFYGFVVFVSFVVHHSRDRDRLTSNLTETCRVHRGSNQSGLGVQNHLHRHRFEHRLERRLVAEGTHEGAGG